MLIETLFLTAPLREANVLLEVKYVCVWESLDIWNFPCKYVLNKKRRTCFTTGMSVTCCDGLFRILSLIVLTIAGLALLNSSPTVMHSSGNLNKPVRSQTRQCRFGISMMSAYQPIHKPDNYIYVLCTKLYLIGPFRSSLET